MPVAEAGTVFADPPAVEKLGPGEGYPDSRFGRSPAKIDTGVTPGYASRAVEEMELDDETGDVRPKLMRSLASASSSATATSSTQPRSAVHATGSRKSH